MASAGGGEGQEIVFMDVETTVPMRAGQGYALLEFGAILVCRRKLVEVGSYSTLIKPANLSLISSASVRCNGITPDSLSKAPSFQQVADDVFRILHGRVWAGHNIARFDCARIREAFKEIGHPVPEPKGIIDSYPLLTQTFGRRAGDMKMATLAAYFGLGQQKHRSIDDVRMNLEIVKYCAAVLFLESNFPNIFTLESGVSPLSPSRNIGDGYGSAFLRVLNPDNPSDQLNDSNNNQSASTSLNNYGAEEIPSIIETDPIDPIVADVDPSDLLSGIDRMRIDASLPDSTMNERPVMGSAEVLPEETSETQSCSGYTGFIDPNEVSVPSIGVSLVPGYQGCSRIILLHKDVLLQLFCMNLKVRFGVNGKFTDRAGRPKLSFVVDAPQSLCRVLDTCDHLAQKRSLESGSNSEWRPLFIRRNSFVNFSTIRLNIPITENGTTATYSTEMYQKEPDGNIQRLVFSRIDAAELDSLFVSGTVVDAYISLEVYDFQQCAGIRLVAKRLVLRSKQE